jgi:hypothetical protein
LQAFFIAPPQGLQTFFISWLQGLAGPSALLEENHLGPAQENPGNNMNKENTNTKEK